VADVVLFHHVQGLTDGLRGFAAELRAGGHSVHTPDLFDGALPASIDDGVALIGRVGGEVLQERAERAVADLPTNLVYAGFSWGAAIAQRFAQTRPGARGALLYEACLPIAGDWAVGPWPDGVPVQIHGMDQDPFFALEGDIDAARQLVESVGPDLASLFVYAGDQHLFIDSSLPSFDAAAAALVLERSREFLDRLT
jgi:dienelactone hydrolase